MIFSQLLPVFAVSAACAAALILARRWHIGLTGDIAGSSTHKIHTGTVPRVGGVAVYTAGLTGLALMSKGLPDITAKIIWMMWGCMTIVFVAGLVEDLTRAVPAAVRYVAALAAALLFSLAHDRYGISSVGISHFDLPLNSTVVRVAFFAFAVASLSHAFNLIDGQNGLCGGVSMLVFVALGLTASRTGQPTLALLSYTMAAANLGFLIFNFPFGRIFLGDGGAYFNGAIAAVLTVFVVQGSSQVSPWLAILILIYPIWETLFSMARRLRARQPFYTPDDDHLHHRMMRLGRHGGSTGLERYASAPILAAVGLITLAAPHIAQSTPQILTAVAVAIGLYMLTYRALRQYARTESAGVEKPAS
jgi:UDP-N-acetylmuramyl pentapeptide phosphotransferase/UDP-N-acetylglucosamine-1-phosphate transferase